jgi:hypothetical protein
MVRAVRLAGLPATRAFLVVVRLRCLCTRYLCRRRLYRSKRAALPQSSPPSRCRCGAREVKKVTTYGSARWAETREVRRAGLLHSDGVLLGRWRGAYLRHDGPEHVSCFAPTRSGKGVGLVVPTLLTWPGSVIVHDIKGENWTLTAGWRARFGRVLLFDPTNANSAAYNPLDEFDISIERAMTEKARVQAKTIRLKIAALGDTGAAGSLKPRLIEIDTDLPFVDDYRTKCIVPRPSFRLILEAVTRLGLAA